MLNYNFLGLMSGSSLDGVDLVIVEFNSGADEVIEWKLLATHEESFDGPWKKRLESAPRLSSIELSRLHADLGVLFGDMCARFIETSGIQPDYIASHGHTVFHAPEHGYTVQIGSPSHIAAHTGVPVIADFRSNDMAHGGQGAPLAPIVEKYLFSGYGFYLNLGGIGNLSVHNGEEIKAWDICACNQLLNYLAAQKGLTYDDKGKLAGNGNISQTLLDELNGVIPLPLEKPYSLDNSFVVDTFIPIINNSDYSVEDRLRTVVEYISGSIASQVHYLISKDGEIFEGRSLNKLGAHVKNHNTGNIGIALLGDYNRDLLPEKQKKSMILLIKALQERFEINKQNIFRHKDLGDTLCPGKNVWAIVQELKEN